MIQMQCQKVGCQKTRSVYPHQLLETKRKAKFCSRSCAISVKNSGVKHSQERRLKSSLSHVGQVAWNKGLKTGLTSDTQKEVARLRWSGQENPRVKNPPKKELHPRWKKDRDTLVKSEKKHLDGQYREWMKSVKERDGWKCKINNNECSRKLEAHHILSWAEYKELRYDINNGITLCHVHHPRGRAKEKQLSPYFSEIVLVSKK